MSRRIHVLVPLKDLEAAKTRLAEVLAADQRRALVRAMAADVLAVLAAYPAALAVQVLSDDPEVAELARESGAGHWSESVLLAGSSQREQASELPRDPLNRVLQAAAERVAAASAPGDLTLILHADLPCLGHADIDAALAALDQSGGMVLACDAQGTGSNLLLFASAAPPVFQFGPGSAEAHRHGAEMQKIPFRCLHLPGVASDIDTPQDLQQLRRQAPGPRTARWLRDWHHEDTRIA